MRKRMNGAPGVMIGFTRGAATGDTGAERCGAVEVGVVYRVLRLRGSLGEPLRSG